MKSKLLFGLIVALSLFGIVAVGHCWDCQKVECYNNVECGVGCKCFKSPYKIKGVCAAKDAK
jgi:hypothetical protein